MADVGLEDLKKLFKRHPEIKLVYLFGSRAVGKEGHLSDYDLALYLDEREYKRMFALKIDLMDRISRILKTDKIDIVILNLVEGPEMKYNIIKEGKLLYSVEPYKVIIEPKILNEYFDFRSMLLRYKLTKA